MLDMLKHFVDLERLLKNNFTFQFWNLSVQTKFVESRVNYSLLSKKSMKHFNMYSYVSVYFTFYHTQFV